MAHIDILDQREPVAGPLLGSVVVHVAIGLLLFGATLIFPGREHWGDPNGGRFGSVAVSPVATIPLPNNGGQLNPLANDTKSKVPEAKPLPKEKPKQKVKAPEPDAIPIPKKTVAKKPPQEPAPERNKWREERKDLPNQLYSTTGQSANNPMYQLRGGGGVGVGTNSPFGSQFGAYAGVLRDRVEQNWHTSELNIQGAAPVGITFSILRNGALVPGSVRVSQSSGNRALDYSAQRAVLDAAPFPPLPQQYSKNQADIELRFELRR
jgi:periplasmic protein TonB